jgi:hypothetical protein
MGCTKLKRVKLIAKPTFEELNKQLSLLSDNLNELVCNRKSKDLTFTKTQHNEIILS